MTLQIIGSISWTTDIRWPWPFSPVAAFLAELTELAFPKTLKCVDESYTFYGTVAFSTLVPIVLVAVIWLVTIPRYVSQEKATSAMLLISFVVLPFASTNLFRVFLCTDFDDGQRFLTADYSLSCDSSAHDYMAVFSSLMLLVFPIGIPLMFAALVWKHRAAIVDCDRSKPCPAEIRHISILFVHYSNGASVYWESAECIRRLLLSSVIIFTGKSSEARCSWGAILAIIFAVVCGELQPCIDPVTQAFAFTSHWIIVAHFMLSVILSIGMGLFSPSLVGVLFIALTVFIVIGAGFTRRRKDESGANELTTLQVPNGNAMNKNEAQPCVMICDPGRKSETELALALLRGLRDLNYIDPKGVIANVWPQRKRACLLRGTLDHLGMHDVPVACGTSGGSAGHKMNTQGAEPYMSQEGSERASTIMTGPQLLEKTFGEALPHSLVLLSTSALTVSGQSQYRALVWLQYC